MSTIIKKLLLIFCLIYFVGCSKLQNPVQPIGGDMIYPLAIGNEWSYVRLFSVLNYRPFQPNVTPPRDTTIFGRDVVRITRQDTLHDSISTFVLLDILYEDARSFPSEAYFNNKEDGLYFYAYKNANHAVPKATLSRKIHFKGRYFNSISEITSLITNVGWSNNSTDDSIRFENPPLKSLPRVYRIGDQWTYRENGKPFRIDKKIVGKELLQTHGGNFECYKVQWLIDFDDNGQWDEEISFSIGFLLQD